MPNDIRNNKTRIATLAGLTALAAISAAVLTLGHTAADADPPPAAPPALKVSVATVTPTSVTTWAEFSGRLEAVERVELRPRVPGTVLAVHFREGALVKAGELLISLDPAPYQAEVDRADAQVAAAQARASYARSDVDRANKLFADQAIAQREFDERVNAAREADANLRAAQASLTAAKLNLSYTQLRAPVAGRVGKLEITVGNQVAAGPSAPLLTTLVSVSPIYASFDADEQIVAALKRDAKVPVQMGVLGQDGTPLEGRLQLVDNQVNARSGTVRVRAVFDNRDGSLIPGQFARIRLSEGEAKGALLVAERAVGTDQNKRFVMVVGAGNKAEYREVHLGATADGLRIVADGLKPSERIVVNGLQRVQPGALLDPQDVPMDAKPEAQARAAAAAKKI